VTAVVPLRPDADESPAIDLARMAVQELVLYWTAKEVGAVLKIAEKSVFRLAASDPTMPCLRLGPGNPGKRGRVRGTLRFPRERLLAWLRSREQGLGQPRAVKPPATRLGEDAQ
jgi:hypothetical protein